MFCRENVSCSFFITVLTHYIFQCHRAAMFTWIWVTGLNNQLGDTPNIMFWSDSAWSEWIRNLKEKYVLCWMKILTTVENWPDRLWLLTFTHLFLVCSGRKDHSADYSCWQHRIFNDVCFHSLCHPEMKKDEHKLCLKKHVASPVAHSRSSAMSPPL